MLKNISIEGLISLVFYLKYFKIVVANTDELKRISYSIRYEVFYSEEGIISEKNIDLENKIEKNESDDNSTHFLLYDKSQKKYTGTIRVINTNRTKETPLFKDYYNTIKTDIITSEKIEKNKESEISRVALLKNNRGFKNNNNLNLYGSMLLYLVGACCVVRSNNKRTFFMIEDRMSVRLRILGINAFKIGENIDLFGKRSVHMITKESFFENLPLKIKPIYNLINHILSKNGL